MLMFLLALAVSQPAPPPADAQAAPAPTVAPAHEMTRHERYEAHMNQVRCHLIETLSGIAQKVCITNRDWEKRQRDNERQVNDFQTRSLSSPY